MEIFERVLIFAAFAAFTLLLGFVFLIARFYEIKAREKIFARAFLPLALLFLFAGGWLALGLGAGDAVSDALLIVAGVGTLGMDYFLFNRLTRRRS